MLPFIKGGKNSLGDVSFPHSFKRSFQNKRSLQSFKKLWLLLINVYLWQVLFRELDPPLLAFEPCPVVKAESNIPVKELSISDHFVLIMYLPRHQILPKNVKILLLEMHLAHLFLGIAVSRLGEFGIVLVERGPFFEVLSFFLLPVDFIKNDVFSLEGLFGQHLWFQDFKEFHFEV